MRNFVSPVLLAQAGQNFEVTLDVGQGKRANSAEIIEEKLTAHRHPAAEARATPGNCSNKIASVDPSGRSWFLGAPSFGAAGNFRCVGAIWAWLRLQSSEPSLSPSLAGGQVTDTVNAAARPSSPLAGN